MKSSRSYWNLFLKRHSRLLLVGGFGFFVCGSVRAVDFDNGAATGDFGNPVNWVGDLFPGIGQSANVSGGFTATLSVDPPNAVGQLLVGLGGVGTINHSAGTLTAGGLGDGRIGPDSGNTGTYHLSGTGILNLTGNFQIGATGTGYFNQTGGTVNAAGFPVVGRFVGGVGTADISAGAFNQTVSGNALIIAEQGRGTLIVRGTGTVNAAGHLWVSHTGGTGVVDVRSGGTLAIATGAVGGTGLRIGNASGAGAVYNRGTVTIGSGASTAHFAIGNAGNASGYFLQDSAITTALQEAGIGGGGGGNGVLEIKSGTVSIAQWLTNNRGAGAQSSMIFLNGGTLQVPDIDGRIESNWGADQYTLIDVAGAGSLLDGGANSQISLNRTGNVTNTGILTVRNGGVVEAPRIVGNATGTTVVNFDNGTLRATANESTNFLQTTLDGVLVHGGGATIDTNGFNVTALAPLLAPTGQGVTSISLGATGTNYISRPIVKITGGGGIGATALANWDETTGQVTGVTVTSPGSGYSSVPTVTIIGGGGSALTATPTLSGGAPPSGGLTKTGTGILTVSGNNTYAGTTVVKAGTLALGAAGAFPSGGALTADGGIFNGAGHAITAGVVTLKSGGISQATITGTAFALESGTVGANLAGSGALTKTTGGTVTLTGTNSYTGGTNIEGGILRLNNGTSIANRWTFNNTLADSVGTSNATIVDVGASNATLGTQQVVLAGGAKASADYVRLGGNLLPNGIADAVTIELWATQQSVQNWSRIFDFGSGTGADQYAMMSWTNGTTLNSDFVEWRGRGTAGNTNQPYTLGTEYHIAFVIEPGAGAGGQTRVGWYSAPSGSPTLGARRGFFDTPATLANLIDTENNLGRSFFGDNTANASYNEARIWSSALSAAALESLHASGPDSGLTGQLPANTAVSISSGATLDLNGVNQTIGSLAGATGSLVTLGSGNLTVGTNHQNTTFAGVISGTGGLSKTGTGRLTLTGTNTYTGPTTVTNGELRVDAPGSVAGSVLVSGSGILSGTGTIGGALTLNGGATFAPGDSPGTITISNGLTLNAGSTFLADIWDPTSDQVLLTGSVTIDNATLSTVWGGDADNIFRGGLPNADQMVWLIINDGSDVIGGSGFINDGGGINSGLQGLFGGGTSPFFLSSGGMNFALFYNADSVGGTLTGGNDLLLIAVPEPSRSLLALLALLPLALCRRRA